MIEQARDQWRWKGWLLHMVVHREAVVVDLVVDYLNPCRCSSPLSRFAWLFDGESDCCSWQENPDPS